MGITYMVMLGFFGILGLNTPQSSVKSLEPVDLFTVQLVVTTVR